MAGRRASVCGLLASSCWLLGKLVRPCGPEPVRSCQRPCQGGGVPIVVRRLLHCPQRRSADGSLMTLPPKRAIDSAGGSLPRRELPTAERWGWELMILGPQGPILSISTSVSISSARLYAIPSHTSAAKRRDLNSQLLAAQPLLPIYPFTSKTFHGIIWMSRDIDTV